MKKFLTSTVVLALVAALLGVFVACGNKTDNTPKGPSDAEIAGQAISTIRTLYAGKAEETPSDYKVNGTQKVGDNVYAITWTVSSEFTGYENYITVGEPNANDNNSVTIGIKKATEVIEYTLTATVTVGKASETVSFKHKVPAGLATTDEQVTKTIDFSTIDNRDSYSADQQVWKQNGITVTNDKGASTTNVDNAWATSADNKQIRFYKSSTVTIEYPGMVKLLFYSTAPYTNGDKVTDYPADLKSSLEAANLGTVTADTENNTVTLVLTAPMDSITFTASAGQLRLTTLDIVANTAGTSDADKVAGAKATLGLDTTVYVAPGAYDLPAAKNGASITWAVDPASDNASVVDGKLNISTMPAAETELTLVATITSNSVTDTKSIKITLKPVAGVTHKGTAEDPYTPSEAKKVAIATLNVGDTAGVDIYVKGYVIAPGTYSTQYKNFDNMYIADVYAADKATTAADSLYVFRPAPDGTYLTTEGFNKGDLVTFRGRLQNYKADTQELVGGVCVAREVVVRSDTQIVEEAKATLTLSKTTFSEAGYELTLPTEKNGATLSNWTVTTETTLVEIAGGKLTVKDLPETATEITLTVTVSSGSVSQTKELVITVEKPFVFEAGNYNIALDLTTVSGIAKTYYFTGNMDGYYGATSDNIVDAAEVVVAESGAGYTLKVGEKYIEITVRVDGSKTYYNFALVDASTGVWTLDEDLEILTFNAGGTPCYLGTYTNNGSTRTTISASKSSYVTADNKGVTQFPISFVKIVEKTPAEKVALVKPTIDLATKVYAEVDEYTLLGEKSGVTLTWSVKEESTLVKVENNTLKILAIPEEDTQIVLVVTLACGTGDDAAEDSKEITISVIAPEPFAEGTYKLVSAQTSLNKTLYFTGELDGNYGATTEYPALAADVVIAQVTGGYTFAVGNKYLELDDAHHIVLVETATKPWKYDYSLEVFIWTHIEGKVYYLGTYTNNGKVYTTISASETSYISGDKAANVGVSQFPAKFEKFDDSTVTDADKIAAALSVVIDTLPNITVVGDTTLATSKVDGVTFTWTLPEGTTAATLNGNTLTVSALPKEEDVELTLTVSASCGEAAPQTKNVTVLIVVPGRITITSTELNLPSSYAASGTAIEGYNFSWIGMADFGDGIQMRTNATTGTSSFWNTVAFDTKIKSLTLVWSDKQNIVANKSKQLKVEFASNVGFTGATTVYATFTTNKTVEVEVPQGDFTFVRITHNNQGVVYLKSVTIVCAPKVSDLDDAGKIEYALDEVPASLDKITEAGDVTLPASNVAGVEFAWTLAEGTTVATLDGNILKVTTLPTTDTTVTLTVSASCGEAEAQTKTVTVIVKAANVNYGTLEAPISVTAALAIAEDECKADNSFTAEKVYMTGKVTNVPTDNGTYYQNIYLADLNDSTKTILVYSINLREGGVAPAQNDVLVIYGYIKNNVYNGTSTIEFASNGSDVANRVYIESNTRGTSTITVNAQEGATVNGLASSALNGTEVSFTVTIADNKELLAVKVNNKAVTADGDGNYKFTVAGDTKVTVDTQNVGDTKPVTAKIDYSAKGYANQTSIQDQKIEADSVASVTMDKNTNSNAPQYYTSGTAIRIYGGGKITVSVLAGYEISKITFTFGSSDGSNAITADVGTFDTNTWTGSARTVVFSIGGSSGNRRIRAIEIEYKATTASTSTQSEATETVSTVEALAVDNKKTVA